MGAVGYVVYRLSHGEDRLALERVVYVVLGVVEDVVELGLVPAPEVAVEDVLKLLLVLLLEEVVGHGAEEIPPLPPVLALALGAEVGVVDPLRYGRHPDLGAERLELLYQPLVAEAVAPDIYLAYNAYQRAPAVLCHRYGAEGLLGGLELLVREPLHLYRVADFVYGVPVDLLALARGLLVGAGLPEALVEQVHGDYAPPREAGEVAADHAELLVEVAVLVGRVDRHILVAQLVEHQPLVAVVLAEAARAVARGHEEGGRVGRKVLSLGNLHHVAGGEYAGVALPAGGEAAPPLQ